MESELTNFQKNMYELRSVNKELKQTYERDMRQWSIKFDQLQMREKEKAIEAEDYEGKFMNVYNKNIEREQQIELMKR